MFFKQRSNKYNWREIFVRYGAKLASLSNPQEVYKTLLQTLTELSGASNASILLYDTLLKQYVLKENMGYNPMTVAISAQHPLILWIKRDAHPLLKSKLIKDSKLLDIKIPALTYFSEWHSEVSFPLMTEKKFLGLLNLGPKKEGVYDTEDIELFSTLLSLGAIFIENAHYYETLYRQNLKLSELAKLKTQFVSNITHELRTPLHGILGLAELLLDDPEKCLSTDYIRYLNMMKNSGSELLEVVDHILELTKYQSGLVELNIKKIDLRRLILEAVAELQPSFDNQECQFLMDWPDSTPGIYGDEQELKQVIHDLISNALKFTKKGKVMVSAQKTGEMLRICVHDTGIGISEEDQMKIFEDFRQADNDLNREYGGTGLGLSLAKKIIELHGGRIWVESKKSMGSSFYFTLPLRPLEASNEFSETPSESFH